MQMNAICQRSMLQTVAGKAIRDLRNGSERGLRNMVELCRGRASPPGYQKFWDMLEEAFRLPGQQYSALLSRAVLDVDLGCLKTLIANLGFHAYGEGSETLRSGWASGTSSAYWMEPLNGDEKSEVLHERIMALQRQGTSSFLLGVEREEQLAAALRIAARHRQCVFFFRCQTVSCCQAYLEKMAVQGNVIPLIRSQELPALAGSLKQAKILFGIHRRYDEIETLETEGRLLHQWINAGCFLGVYEGCSPDPRDDCGLSFYAKLQELRHTGAVEILLLDFWRDREVVQKLLLHQQFLPDCSWNGALAINNKCMKEGH